MKKFPSFLCILLTATSLLAQEVQHSPSSGSVADSSAVGSSQLPVDLAVTSDDNGKTITLHVGDVLNVQFYDQHHGSSEDDMCGFESVSTISFNGFSKEGILANEVASVENQTALQQDRNFVAVAPGCTTLSYKLVTLDVVCDPYTLPMFLAADKISFNIVVVE